MMFSDDSDDRPAIPVWGYLLLGFVIALVIRGLVPPSADAIATRTLAVTLMTALVYGVCDGGVLWFFSYRMPKFLFHFFILIIGTIIGSVLMDGYNGMSYFILIAGGVVESLVMAFCYHLLARRLRRDP